MRLSAWARGVLVLLVAVGLWGFAAPAASSARADVVARRHTERNRSAGTSGRPAGPATGAFGLELMRRLSGGNLVFSPDSIAAALAMAGSGAGGQTAEQIAHVLQLSSPGDFAEVGQLQSSISAEQLAAAGDDPEAPTLEIANGLFVQQGFSLREPFLSGVQRSFGAAPQTVDFGGGGASAVEAINTWVSEHTRGLIPQILGSVPPATVLALANAIYLKAAWSYPFKASATTSSLFHGQHRAASMPFMHQTEKLPYSHGKGYVAVELPYQASTLSLLIVLPVGRSIASLQRRLGAAELAQIADRLTPEPVALSLPRFQLEFHGWLNAPLEELGMTDAFGEHADFSGIAAEPLKLGLVEHASDFSVDEQGTLATAATTITLEPLSARFPVKPTVQFDANRPFLFFLRDDDTGAVLFSGRLTEPAATQTP
jgi:serpin B